MEWLVGILIVSLAVNAALIAIFAPVAVSWWEGSKAELEEYERRQRASRSDEG